MEKEQNPQLDFERDLKKDLTIKGLIIPVIFAIVVAVAMFLVSNPSLNIFPNGNYQDTDDQVVTVETIQSEYMGQGGADSND